MSDEPDPTRRELPPPDPEDADGLTERARAVAEDLTPRQRRQLRRLTTLVTLALVVFLFIMQNREEVSVSFILFTAETRLIWVMILCLAAGGVAGYLLTNILRRRRETR